MFTSYQYWEQTTAIIQSLNTNIIENIFLSAKHLITEIIEEPSITTQSRADPSCSDVSSHCYSSSSYLSSDFDKFLDSYQPTTKVTILK